MKGVSAVIATILMLMITIALSGTAYLYISGFFGSKTGVVLSLDPSSRCTSSAFTVVLRNDGTSVASNIQIDIKLPDSTTLTADCNVTFITAGGTNSTTCPISGPSATNGFYGVRAYGGGATATGNIYCGSQPGNPIYGTTTTGTASGTTSSTTSTTAPPGGTSFSNRKTMTIDNRGSSTTLSNYAITTVMNTATLISGGQMASDCSNMRFADSTGYDYTAWPYNYSYYIPAGECNSANTHVTVKFNSIPASATKTIYMYYGGVTLPQFSNAQNTYAFFDQYSTDTTGSYTLYNQGGATPTLSYNSPSLNVYTGGASMGTGYEHIWYNAIIPDSVSVSMAIKSDGATNDCGQGIAFFYDVNNWLTVNYGGTTCAATTGPAVQVKQSIGGNIATVNWVSQAHDTNWHILRMDKINNYVNVSLDGTSVITNSIANAFFDRSDSHIGLDIRTGNTANEYWDNVTARPFVMPEPTLS
jgi:flagellin-like protein